jgi:hypothetical protein
MEMLNNILGYTKEDINTDEYLFGTSENTLYGRMKDTYELYYNTTIKEILPYKPIISQLAEAVETREAREARQAKNITVEESAALSMLRKALDLASAKITEEKTQLEDAIKEKEEKKLQEDFLTQHTKYPPNAEKKTEEKTPLELAIEEKLKEHLTQTKTAQEKANKIYEHLKNIDISYNDVESAKYIQNMEEVKFNKLLKSYIIYNRFDKDINLFDEDTTITSNMVVIEDEKTDENKDEKTDENKDENTDENTDEKTDEKTDENKDEKTDGNTDEKCLPFLIYNNSFFNISGKPNIKDNNNFLPLLKLIFAKVKMVGQISYTTSSDNGFESDINERLTPTYDYQDKWTIQKPETIMKQCEQNMKQGVWMTYTDKDIYYMISPYFLEYLYKGTDDKKWFGENYNLPKSSQEMENDIKYDETRFNQPNLFGRIFVPINKQGHGYGIITTELPIVTKKDTVETSILGAKYKIRQYGITNAKESEFNRINNHFYSKNWAQGKVTGGKSKKSSKKYTAKKKK